MPLSLLSSSQTLRLVALTTGALLGAVLISVFVVEQTDLEAASLLLIGAIVVGAFWGEAMFGFGGGLIAIPFVSLLIGVRDAVTFVLLFQISMGLLLVQNHRAIASSLHRGERLSRQRLHPSFSAPPCR